MRIEKFLLDTQNEYTGVVKIAKKVAEDVKLVTDITPEFVTEVSDNTLVCGTLEKSEIIKKLADKKVIDISKIEGKREVYGFWNVNCEGQDILVIAGSDKRGAIYGLFHLSELMGVSPWIYFADVMPAKNLKFEVNKQDNFVSREPSVKYRGIFINDEWPSFGNWTFKHFGGFTVEMYDHVFELILRLKGNYLWPAMWTSNFSLDGPGLENAILADEYGIVMSNSHHEPCLRHSEEWDKVRGEDSIYGNAWNFDQNKEGLKNYWRDGLKRNGKFENIITMGMRGERDSEILGHTATLKDNIDYLKEVIETQNELIKETVNEKLDDVPRMLALYKEVEAYFYGDDKTPGLKDWEELDGITFMLCEDNFGNMRTLPPKAMKDRKGGWGMYYHFDYHGDPISYEWVNSTYLPKVWEQMSMAYDFGIRDIWVVNTGDLKPQELPISYFMDLAYDFTRFGTDMKNNTEAYTRTWIKNQFGAFLADDDLNKIFDLIEAYTRQNHIRKPETLHLDVYDPVNYYEADKLIEAAKKYIEDADYLKLKVQGKPIADAFYELVYFPVVASFNLDLMWMYAGKNHLYAKQGKLVANAYASLISDTILLDKDLEKEYHSINNGKWDGMMMSEHIGFTHWNDEECAYPIRSYVESSNKNRLLVNLKNSKVCTSGEDWTRKTLYLYDFLDPKCDRSVIELSNASAGKLLFEVKCEADWLSLSKKQGTVSGKEEIEVRIDRNKLNKNQEETTIKVCQDRAYTLIKVLAAKLPKEIDENKYVPVLPKDVPVSEDHLGLVLEASDFVENINGSSGKFEVLKPFGKYESGLKAFPSDIDYTDDNSAPYVSYEFICPQDGEYEIKFIFAPSNPISVENKLCFGVSLNGEGTRYVSLIKEDYLAGNGRCKEWADAVLNNTHEVSLIKKANLGTNLLKVYAASPAVVLERILVRDATRTWEKGFTLK